MKKIQTILILLVFWGLSVNLQAQFSGGTGTSNDPYQITTAAQLVFLSTQIASNSSTYPNSYNTKCYKLMNDINLAAYGAGWTNPQYYNGWHPIGCLDPTAPTTDYYYAFKGVFDGNSKTVSNLYVRSAPYTSFIGLFGLVNGGTVKNLTVTNVDVFSNSDKVECCAGAVVANVLSGTVSNCHSSGQVISASHVGVGNTYTGGVVGNSWNSTVSGCSSSCDVNARLKTVYVGGVVGCLENGALSNCYSTGAVTANNTLQNAFSGGVLGWLDGTASMSNCYSTGTILCSGNNQKYALAGGCVGYITTTGSISKCYSTGAVTATGGKYSYAGGIVGYTETSSGCNIANCYSIGAITASSAAYTPGLLVSGGIAGYNAGSGAISNCYATGAITTNNTTNVSEVYAAGIAGVTAGSISNCAALNPRISCAGREGDHARICIIDNNNLTLSNNVGFINMINAFGNVEWWYMTLNGGDGANITASTIIADGTIGGRFITANGWTVQNGKLPSFGGTINIPPHIAIVAPHITTTSLPNGVVGTAYSQTLTATGDTPITWTIASGNLPNGLTLSSAGVISGTPTTAGTFNFTVKAINSAGNDTKALSITISTNAVAPVITTTSLPNGTVGSSYNQTLAATGTAPITWSLASGSLPNGLTLSSAGVISGTPTAAGISNFTVKATNSAGNDTKALSITIISNVVAPVITTTSLPNGTVGSTYDQMLAATGTVPISWSLVGGALPNGLTLSSMGVISGTPTATGTSNFTVKATNSAGSDTKALSITVNVDAVAPVITTTSLSNGTVNSAYYQPLAATGTAPITWSIASGTLPNGLTLSSGGVISGTPTAAGTSNFTVKATNSIGSDTKALSITVINTSTATYIITANGSNFNVSGATTITNVVLQEAINGIRTHAAGQPCTIQFGSGGSNVLDLVAEESYSPRILFTSDGSPAWGAITLTGKATSMRTYSGVIRLEGNVSITSQADLTLTGPDAAMIRNEGTGAINIIGGTVQAIGNYSSYAICNYSTGIINISGGTVSGNGGVTINNDIGGTLAISGGMVKLTGGGPAISNSGQVIITGGEVKGEDTPSGAGWGLHNYGGTVTISGGTVSGTTYAILNYNSTNNLGTITISGGEVKKIEGGPSNSTIDNDATLIINGTAKVSATGEYVSAIYNTGTLTITDNSEVWSTGDYAPAIAYYYSYDNEKPAGKITISGYAKVTSHNTHSNIYGGTIYINNYSASTAVNLAIEGGTVTNTSDEGHAINIHNEGTGTIAVSGGMITAKNGYAIRSNGMVALTGGILFAYGTAANDVIDGMYSQSGNAVITAWNKYAGTTTYQAGTTTDIFRKPTAATAIWSKKEGNGGIAVENGNNKGFITIEGITITGMGVEELTMNNEQLTIYPNPTNGELRIENGELRMENVEIFDVYGRKVSSHHHINTSSHHLDVSQFPAGVYFLKIRTEAGEVVKKVVKE